MDLLTCNLLVAVLGAHVPDSSKTAAEGDATMSKSLLSMRM